MTTVVVGFRIEPEKRERLRKLAERRGHTWGKEPNPGPLLREFVTKGLRDAERGEIHERNS
jgi:predicted transcriptional regulator